MDRQNPRKSKNFLLKLVSLLFGFAFWYLFTHEQQSYQQIAVPISFHDIPSDFLIKAPETIEITIRGKRIDLHNLNAESLAFHINAGSLKKGKNSLSLSTDHLFLPDHVSLLNYSPSTILVYVHDKQNQGKKNREDLLHETTAS